MAATPPQMSPRLRRLGPGVIQLPSPPVLAPPLARIAEGSDGVDPLDTTRPAHERIVSFGSRRSRQSPSPWEGAVMSPGIAVAPAAVDYFQGVSGEQHSMRALNNLLLVACGRCVVTLGLAACLEAYVPGNVFAAPPQPTGNGGPPPVPSETHLFHPVVLGLGVAGTVAGLISHTTGIARFYNDTASINRTRANVVVTAAMTGAILVTSGGAFYLYGVISGRYSILYEALPLRSLGNFFVFGAIPNSFGASELVHGDIPLRNRLLWRDVAFALGGMFLMTWAQISTPDPPAPLWAREIAQCLGIICIAIGGALPRVDSQRASAELRSAVRRTSELNRRRSSALAVPSDDAVVELGNVVFP